MFSPSGSHCRSLLEAPSVVNCFRSEPSTFMSQISLLATMAILSAPPRAGNNGGAGFVGVAGISVLVTSTTITGTFVGVLATVAVSVTGGGTVSVLTGTCVGGIFLFLVRLKRKTPPAARTAIPITGTMTSSALNPFFSGIAFWLIWTVGTTSTFVALA